MGSGRAKLPVTESCAAHEKCHISEKRHPILHAEGAKTIAT